MIEGFYYVLFSKEDEKYRKHPAELPHLEIQLVNTFLCIAPPPPPSKKTIYKQEFQLKWHIMHHVNLLDFDCRGFLVDYSFLCTLYFEF